MARGRKPTKKGACAARDRLERANKAYARAYEKVAVAEVRARKAEARAQKAYEHALRYKNRVRCD